MNKLIDTIRNALMFIFSVTGIGAFLLLILTAFTLNGAGVVGSVIVLSICMWFCTALRSDEEKIAIAAASIYAETERAARKQTAEIEARALSMIRAERVSAAVDARLAALRETNARVAARVEELRAQQNNR